MLNKGDLEAISQIMDVKLKPVIERLDRLESDVSDLKSDVSDLKSDVSDLKESQEETRSGVNALLEWAEECGNVIKFPLPKVK